MITLTKQQIRNWFVEATQKQDLDLRRFAILVINADEPMWNRIKFTAVKIMQDDVYNERTIKYSKEKIYRMPEIEQDITLESMRGFYRLCKDKGGTQISRFAELYLNADDRMLNYIFVPAYFLMKDYESKIKGD